MCSRSLAKAVLTALNAHTTDQGTHPRPDSTSCRRVACPSGLLSLIKYSGVNSGSVPSTRVSIPYQLAGTSQGHGWEEKSPPPPPHLRQTQVDRDEEHDRRERLWAPEERMPCCEVVSAKQVWGGTCEERRVRTPAPQAALHSRGCHTPS